MTGSASITASVAGLSSVTVTASSYTVLASSVDYSLTLTSAYAFTSISIDLPPEITVASGFETTCTPNTFSSCSLSGSNLTYQGNLPAGTYTLGWGQVTNPASLKPSFSSPSAPTSTAGK